MKRLLLVFILASCGIDPVNREDGGADPVDSGSAVVDAGSFSCTPCLETSECGPGAACVQYAGNDFCGHLCYAQVHCGPDEVCIPTVAEDGTQLSACEDEEWVVELSLPWKLLAPGGRPSQLPLNFSRLETLEGERIREVWSRGCGALALE